ncbi:glycosyltransferase family 2 protein [Mycobacterium sp. SM3041]|uniref:glycosyltransferase family 2 protein n=1 Tax=Mycobacterium sp. SM3041 TaxID=3114291 RepID=UPI003204A57E
MIVVTFNSASTLLPCLSSIPADCEVIVVDQESSDDSVPTAVRIRPDVALIRAGSNRGFGAGCNLGAANAAAEILIFLNPDAAFCSADTVRVLADCVANNDAVVGPRILDANGEDQTRARYWSRPVADIAEVFLPVRLLVGKLRRDVPRTDAVYTRGGPVPYAQGSCIAISAKNFRRVGGFDERFYLYQEEELLARRLLEFGVKALLEPRAVITHIGGCSTSQYPDFSASQYYRSVALSYILFRRRIVALPTIAVLWVVLQLMAASTPLRKAIGLRSDKSRTWYRAAASGIVSGLRRQMVSPPTLLSDFSPS